MMCVLTCVLTLQLVEVFISVSSILVLTYFSSPPPTVTGEHPPYAATCGRGKDTSL